MSLLDVWIEPELALVGVDTEIVATDGKFDHVSKMLTLPHMNAVIASRGHLVFLTQMLVYCHWSGGDFDTLLPKIPEYVDLAFRDSLLTAKNLGMTDDTPLDGQVIVLVGWSRSQGRMIGREFNQENRKTGFIAEDIKKHHIAPWDPYLKTFPDPNSFTNMANLARAQTRLMHDKVPGVAAGGRFIIAQIRREGMMISPACELGSAFSNRCGLKESEVSHDTH